MHMPNLQNIPVLPRPNPAIRRALFGPYYEVIPSSADYSGIEKSLLAAAGIDPKDPYGILFRK